MSVIKKSVAVLLCDRIREENQCHWYTVSGLTCRLCMRSSKGDPLKMRIRRKNRYNGCRLVNDWYDKLSGTKGKEKLRKMA